MPRAALLSIHARVEGTGPDMLDDPSLAQVWGPRFSAYVVAAVDVAAFTLGRLPDDAAGRARATGYLARLEAFLAGREMPYGTAGRGIGVPPNALRYTSPTGAVRIRWDGARQPTIRTVPGPAVDPFEARLELARRYLHVLGPGTSESFGGWAGIRSSLGRAALEALTPWLAPVRTPIGDGWILAADEASYRSPGDPPETARLLPSGDAYVLLWGADRDLLVPQPDRQARLWTPRVWPGAVLLRGEIVGTWRRSQADVTIEPWQPLSSADRALIEREAGSLPLPGLATAIGVSWTAIP
jgi:hypothetical protein